MIVELATAQQAATLHTALVHSRFDAALRPEHPRVIETTAPRKVVEELSAKTALQIESLAAADWEE